MAPPTGSNIQMQLKNGVISPRLNRSAVVLPSQPVYRVEPSYSRKNRKTLKDAEIGVMYLLATLRLYLAKDCQSVFLYRFFKRLRCKRGQTDFQRWMVKYEIARQKAVDAWLDLTTPRPDPASAAEQLREAAREQQRAEVRQTCVGAPGGLVAAVDAVALPDATPAMTEAAVETVWRVQRRAQFGQFPITDNLAARTALVVADLSESQRETLMNLILQQGVDLTALTVQQLREFLTTMFHAPKSTLDKPSWTSRGKLDEYEGRWVQDADASEDPPATSKAGSWRKEEERPKKRARKEKAKEGNSHHCAASLDPREKEEEKARRPGRQTVDLLEGQLLPKKKREKPRKKHCWQTRGRRKGVRNRKRRARPSQRHLLRVRLMRSTRRALPTVSCSYMIPWFLLEMEAVQEGMDSTVMILDTGCTKAMCSRVAYRQMRTVYPGTRSSCSWTPAPSTLPMDSRLWQERGAECGFHISHLCSSTSPLLMKVECPFSCLFRRWRIWAYLSSKPVTQDSMNGCISTHASPSGM